MTDDRCDVCGAELETYRVYDPDTGRAAGWERTCPFEWRHGRDA